MIHTSTHRRERRTGDPSSHAAAEDPARDLAHRLLRRALGRLLAVAA